ncbi:hypothetical protein ACPPVT_04470 [Angustibacter sp. McL0619]|uniref:hypothetical protein n=1 Tax=Angustibacter sp. McL0619 TaxID=3415676 RepID=UPI003CECC5BE
MSRQVSDYGPGIVRLYYPGMPTSWSRIESLTGNRPGIISFKMAPSQVNSGAYDAGLRAWFAAAPNRLMYWSYHPEPEDDIANGNFTAAQFRSAYARIAGLANAVDNAQLKSTWMLMCWTARPGSGRDWHDYWPGTQYVDVVGFDCANKLADRDKYADPASMLRDPLAVADAVNKPWGLGEFESRRIAGDSGSGRAAWLLAMARFAQANSASFASYFDANRAVDFTLSDAASRNAWHSVVSDQLP